MNKGTITIELPILDKVDQMEVVNTFNEKQLWYVCAIAKAFEKSLQELQRKDNIINELEYGIQKIRDLLYEKCRIRDEDGYYSMNNTDLQDFYDILDKIKELENDL